MEMIFETKTIPVRKLGMAVIDHKIGQIQGTHSLIDYNALKIKLLKKNCTRCGANTKCAKYKYPDFLRPGYCSDSVQYTEDIIKLIKEEVT